MAIFQVVHKQRLLSQEVRNVFYYETQVGNPSAAEWQAIADEIRADYVSALQAGYVSTWSFYGIDYRQVDTPGLPTFSVVPTLGSVAGTSAYDSVATQVAMLVSVKENVTKPNHCRSYLAGGTEASLTASLWGAGARTNAETFIDLQAVLNGGGTNPLQRVSAQWNLTHTQVIAYNNVAGAPAIASEVPATQRRRRIGVGV